MFPLLLLTSQTMWYELPEKIQSFTILEHHETKVSSKYYHNKLIRFIGYLLNFPVMYQYFIQLDFTIEISSLVKGDIVGFDGNKRFLVVEVEKNDRNDRVILESMNLPETTTAPADMAKSLTYLRTDINKTKNYKIVYLASSINY